MFLRENERFFPSTGRHEFDLRRLENWNTHVMKWNHEVDALQNNSKTEKEQGHGHQHHQHTLFRTAVQWAVESMCYDDARKPTFLSHLKLLCTRYSAWLSLTPVVIFHFLITPWSGRYLSVNHDEFLRLLMETRQSHHLFQKVEHTYVSSAQKVSIGIWTRLEVEENNMRELIKREQFHWSQVSFDSIMNHLLDMRFHPLRVKWVGFHGFVFSFSLVLALVLAADLMVVCYTAVGSGVPVACMRLSFS
jgi:hypothetical protein